MNLVSDHFIGALMGSRWGAPLTGYLLALWFSEAS